MFLCRRVPLLQRDLERSDAGGLRELRVDREEGIVAHAKVGHPGFCPTLKLDSNYVGRR